MNALVCLTLAVVGMPSMPLALWSANFFARFAFSSDTLSGISALLMNREIDITGCCFYNLNNVIPMKKG